MDKRDKRIFAPVDEGAAAAALETWLATRGAQLSEALDMHGDQICATVSARLAATFPSLCYDSTRADAALFQQQMFDEVPRRFQRVLQAVLLVQSVAVIEQEYRWGWTILLHYGVAPLHLLAHVRWYFSAIRATVPLDKDELKPLDTLERNILQIIEDVTANTALPYRQTAHDKQGIGDGIWGTGRRETGDGRRETRNGRRETGDRRHET